MKILRSIAQALKSWKVSWIITDESWHDEMNRL